MMRKEKNSRAETASRHRIARHLCRITVVALGLSCLTANATYVNSWTVGNLTWKLSSTPLSTAKFGGDYEDIKAGRATINITGVSYKNASDIANLTIPTTVGWKSGGSNPTLNVRVNRLNSGAFKNCLAVKTVTVPLNVIGQPCFLGCSNLTAINGNYIGKYTSEDGILYDYGKTILKKYPEGKVGDTYTVPATVNELTEYCLSNTKLTTIYFQGNVPTASGTTFFTGSEGLQAICYPQGATGWTNPWKGIPTYAVPNAVTGLSASQGTSESGVTLTWSPNSIATSYVIYRSTSASGDKVQLATLSGSTIYTDTSAAAGTAYYYSIVARNGNYSGASSATVQGWKKSATEYVTITFDPRGGSMGNASPTRTIVKGSAIGALPTPTKDGCAFVRWSRTPIVDRGADSGFISKCSLTLEPAVGGIGLPSIPFDGDVEELITANSTFSSDTTLYADYSANSYTLTFDAHGGSVSETSRGVSHGAAVGELPEPTWAGHSFLGWYTMREGGIRMIGTEAITDDLTLYAHWEKASQGGNIAWPGTGGIPQGCDGEFYDGTYTWLWRKTGNGAELTGYAYNTTNNEGVVLGHTVKGIYPEPEGTVTIPSAVEFVSTNEIGEVEHGTLAVICVGYYCLRDCSDVTSVSIPETVETIGAGAFEGTGLVQVHLPDGVKTIGYSAFGFTPLETVNVPASLQTVEGEVFQGTPWLEAQGEYAIYGKGFLQAYQGESVDVAIPDAVRVICEFAFGDYDYAGIESVYIPDSVTDIQNNAFYCCESLETVTGGVNVRRVGWDAFFETALWNDAPEGSVVKAGNMIVGHKGDVEGTVVIEDGVAVIAASAFDGCESLDSITLPLSLRSIGDCAFWGTAISRVDIPPGVEEIGYGVFDECWSLADMAVPQSVCSIGLYNVAACAYDTVTNITIHAGTERIEAYAFSGLDRLESVTVPASVKEIGEGSFEYCPSLRSVTINGLLDDYEVDIYGEVDDEDEWTTSKDLVTYITADWTGPTDKWLGRNMELIVDTEELVAPVIMPADGTMFAGDLCEVTITCPTKDAVIYYTTNGVTPKQTIANLYNGAFVIHDTATIKTVAVKDGERSEYVAATITKQTLTLDGALGVGSGVAVTTGGDAPWTPILDRTTEGGMSARSGSICDNEESWVEVSVSGAGVLSFRCKVSCEHDDDGTCTWDCLKIYVNGTSDVCERTGWRIDGETSWLDAKTVLFEDAGVHTVRWVYHKDVSDADGEDCAWLCGVTWKPIESAVSPFPEVATNATSETVAAALSGAVDAGLAANVVDGTNYNAFCEWAAHVKGASGSTAVGAQTVKESSKAWLSYALGADRLITKELMNDDVKIESFAPTSTNGKFEFTISVKDVNIGGGSVAEAVLKENLKKVLGIESAASLDPAAFSSDNIDITFDAPVDGKARFTVSPPNDAGNSFFMRVKVK